MAKTYLSDDEIVAAYESNLSLRRIFATHRVSTNRFYRVIRIRGCMPRNPCVSTDRDLIAAHDAGMGVKQIMDTYHAGSHRIYRVTKASARPRRLIAKEEDILEAYQSDMRTTDLISTLRIGIDRLYRVVRKHKVETRRQKFGRLRKPPSATLLAAVEAYQRGDTIDSIRTKFGLYNQTIYRMLKRLNIPLRSSTGPYNWCLWCGETITSERSRAKFCNAVCKKDFANDVTQELVKECFVTVESGENREAHHKAKPAESGRFARHRYPH